MSCFALGSAASAAKRDEAAMAKAGNATAASVPTDAGMRQHVPAPTEAPAKAPGEGPASKPRSTD